MRSMPLPTTHAQLLAPVSGVRSLGSEPAPRALSLLPELLPFCPARPCTKRRATDSISFKRKAGKILNGTKARRQKPWDLRRDGDLWQIWERLALERGLRSVIITWGKGHATSQDVKDGRATEVPKVANDIGDRLADLGVSEGHQIGLIRLAAYYAAKQRKVVSISITKTIHRIMLNVLKAEHDERAKRDKDALRVAALLHGPMHAHIEIPKTRKAPPYHEGRGLDLLPPKLDGLSDTDATLLLDVWCFLNTTRCVHTEGRCNGTSWVELRAHFHNAGGRLTAAQVHDDPLAILRNFKQAVATFRKSVLRVVALYALEYSTWLFRPACVPQARLKAYGCTTHLPCILGELCLSGDATSRLRDAIATVAVGHDRMHSAKAKGMPLMVKPHKVSFRGPPHGTSQCSKSASRGSRKGPRRSTRTRYRHALPAIVLYPTSAKTQLRRCRDEKETRSEKRMQRMSQGLKTE